MKNTLAGLQLVCLALLVAAATPIALEHLDARADRRARAARVKALVAVGQAALGEKDPVLAAQAFADAASLDPGDAALRRTLLDAQVARLLLDGVVITAGNALPLQVALTQALAAEPDGPATRLLALGRVLQFRGRIDAARAQYSAAVEKDPSAPLGHLFIGDLHLKLGEHEAAARHLSKALELDEDLVGARLALGQTRLAQERYDAARPLLEAAVKAQPTDARAQAALGRTALALDDFAAARVHLERAALLAPKVGATYARLGEAWMGLEKPERAVQAFLRAWTVGGDVDALRKAAHLRAEQRGYEAAFEAFQQLVTAVPDDAEAHYMTGRMAHALGNARLAMAAYERAIQYAGRAPDMAEVATKAKDGIAEIRKALAAAQAKAGATPRKGGASR